MRRLFVLAGITAALVIVGILIARRSSVDGGAPVANPVGFVASDVARLAATGRPQLVEVFHYG
jgi:hypothetical protein